MSKPQPKLTGITEELLQGLETLFPEKCPSLTDQDREIWFYAGKRALVDFIKHQHQLNKQKGLDESPVLGLESFLPK